MKRKKSLTDSQIKMYKQLKDMFVFQVNQFLRSLKPYYLDDEEIEMHNFLKEVINGWLDSNQIIFSCEQISFDGFLFNGINWSSILGNTDETLVEDVSLIYKLIASLAESIDKTNIRSKRKLGNQFITSFDRLMKFLKTIEKYNLNIVDDKIVPMNNDDVASVISDEQIGTAYNNFLKQMEKGELDGCVGSLIKIINKCNSFLIHQSTNSNNIKKFVKEKWFDDKLRKLCNNIRHIDETNDLNQIEFNKRFNKLKTENKDRLILYLKYILDTLLILYFSEEDENKIDEVFNYFGIGSKNID